MNVLLIGSGVIGSIYGGQLSLGGHKLSVLAFGPREKDLAINGIRLKNLDNNRLETAGVTIVADVATQEFDLVIVAVNAEQVASTFPTLLNLTGKPHILFFGNNPDGHKLIPDDLPGTVQLGFPGVAGSLKDGVVEYIPVDQQPTALEVHTSPANRQIHATLKAQGLPLQDITNMDGWLAYHSVFISCIESAIIKADTQPEKLGSDPALLKLMCSAITEGFQALKKQGVKGLPNNLSILHSPLLKPIAVRYWGKLMRSPKGELYFGAHTRHASNEVHALATWVLMLTEASTNKAPHLYQLLS
jgi:2-dehydropantoate 2-reductase